MIRKLKNTIHFLLAIISSLYFRVPGRYMTVIGITGTSGKTTTAHLVYEILIAAGKRVSLISTISAVINGKSYDTGFHVTTPSAWQIQKFMRQAANRGCDYFVLEVTSHGLDQHRVFGTSIDIGVITNIVHEHLDYHGSLWAYRAAKAKILTKVRFAVLNKDDNNFVYLREKVKEKVITFAIDKQADYTLSDFNLEPRIPGKFNLYNALCAATISAILKIKKETIEKTVAGFLGIPGRMEEIKIERPFKIIIDFAHKPDALTEALTTARDFTKNKLIVVFGCAGLRDKLKRPVMGEIAAKMADYVVLTAEDPRTEDVRDIIEQIAAGCVKVGIKDEDKRDKKLRFLKNGQRYFWRIPDRQEAINFAIRYLAKKGDVVLLCGKGHERSMCYGTREYPWDERKAIEKALRARS